MLKKTTTAAALIALLMLTAAAAGATEESSAPLPFTLKFQVTPDGDRYTLEATITQNDTGEVLANPRLTAELGVPAQIRTFQDDTGRAIWIDVTTDKDGHGKLRFTMLKSGEELQRQSFTFVVKADSK